ncbi:hypothetical protein IQ07DRAFT_597766 [Pyrenochaeta sp. DS3sAY3a]|nr:hypothetical protein IQ07DRAFT_597766 [Pyrenochaeta sp. DS3sAY3a]
MANQSTSASRGVRTDPLQSVVIGYPKLAAKTEIQPEFSIYRRFGALNAQNLLYFQAELAELEEELRTKQNEDENNPTGKKCLYSKSWFRLQDSEIDGDTEQLQLVYTIRKTLQDYSQCNEEHNKAFCPSAHVASIDHALIQQSQILKYATPTKWELKQVQDYLQAPEMGRLALLGPDATVWGSTTFPKRFSPDLVSLCPRAKADPFSTWLADNAIFGLLKCGCTRFMKPLRVHGAIGYDDSTIYRMTYWFTGILASLIPIASIVVLYCVHSMPGRLATIAAFNVLVAVCLIGFARANRAEIFAVTAAFAAVQVVFVGQDKSI